MLIRVLEEEIRHDVSIVCVRVGGVSHLYARYERQLLLDFSSARQKLLDLRAVT